MAQYGPQLQAFNASQQLGQQQLATNTAEYGPQGYLAGQLQTNTGLQQQLLGISELSNTQQQQAAESQFGTQIQNYLGGQAAAGAASTSANRSGLQTLSTSQILQSEQFKNTAAANNISGQQLANQLTQGMQQLGITGEQNKQQILQAAAQGYQNLPTGLAQLISSVASAGGVANIWATSSGGT
jgi:hypothetical protein